MTVVVGQIFASDPLPAATVDGDGDLNEPLTYSIIGDLPAGLSMNSARQIVGTPSASNLVDLPEGETTKAFMVMYKVVDSDPHGESDEDTANITITVNPAASS